MLTAPVKPVSEMTAEELRQWKACLVEQGQNPRSWLVDQPLSGSLFEFDASLKSVVETTGTGSRYIVEVREGAIVRASEVGFSVTTPLIGNTSEVDNGPIGFAAAMLGVIILIVTITLGPGAITRHDQQSETENWNEEESQLEKTRAIVW